MQQTEVYTCTEISADAIYVEKAQPNLTSPQTAFTKPSDAFCGPGHL